MFVYVNHIVLSIYLLFFLLPQAAAQIAANEIPVLCYHQVVTGHSNANSITLSVDNFNAQLKLLHDSGYKTILPGDLYAYILQHRTTNAKIFLLTFDDGSEGQYMNALPVLNKYGFKATFFIMTIALNKPGYLSAAQIMQLQQQGHIIGNHTWDHHNVRSYTQASWYQQLDKPAHSLQLITGKMPEYFSYPYGSWTDEAIKQLQLRKYKLAFILHTKASSVNPNYTVRRLMVYNSWKPAELLKKIKQTFPAAFN